MTVAGKPVLIIALVAGAALGGLNERLPAARVFAAPRLSLPGLVDSNTPMVRDLLDGEARLFVMVSWGGTPSLSVGPNLDQLPPASPVGFEPHPGHGVWMESVIVSEDGTWYGYYHQERPAEIDAVSSGQLPMPPSKMNSPR